MGSNPDKRWYDIIRDRILGRSSVPSSEREDDCGVGAEIRASDGDNPPVPPDPEAPGPEEQQADAQHVSYTPPEGPEVAPPQVLGAMSDGTSMMYVQTCFWVASYVQMRSQQGDFTQDQLIEQFGVNVRRCIDPKWKGQG